MTHQIDPKSKTLELYVEGLPLLLSAIQRVFGFFCEFIAGARE